MAGREGAVRASGLIPARAVAAVPAVFPPLVAGVCALALGLAVVQPGVGYWDTAEFQAVGPLLGTAHPTGFPAYVLLSWLASIVLQPFGEPAFRINVLSTILVALAASGTAVLALLLTERRWLAMTAGVALALTPVAWTLATRADPHAFNLAAVAVVLVLFVAWERASTRAPNGRHPDRLLVAACIAYGVALAGHAVAVLLAPGIALFVVRVDRRLRARPRLALAYCAVVVATAAVFYLELPIRALMGAPLVYDHPDTVVGFLTVTLGGQFSGTLGHPAAGLDARVADLLASIVRELGALAPLAPVALGVSAWRRPRYTLLTAPGAALITAFAASYTNADIERYYAVPALIVITWFAILASSVVDAALAGLRRVVAAGRHRFVAAGPRPGTAAYPHWPVEVLVAVALVLPSVLAAPSRVAAVDQRGNTAAADWLDAAFAVLPPRSVVVSWWDYSTTLWYGQLVEGRRPDIWIVDDRTRLDQELGDVSDVIASQLGRRPVFLIRLPDEVRALEARFTLRPVPTVPGGEPLEEVLGDRRAAVVSVRP